MSMKIAAGHAAVSPRRGRQPLGLPIAWWGRARHHAWRVLRLQLIRVDDLSDNSCVPSRANSDGPAPRPTGALTVATLLTIVGAPAAGLCIDRFGPRRVLLVASLLLPLAVACLSLSDGGLRRYYLTLAAIAVVGGRDLTRHLYRPGPEMVRSPPGAGARLSDRGGRAGQDHPAADHSVAWVTGLWLADSAYRRGPRRCFVAVVPLALFPVSPVARNVGHRWRLERSLFKRTPRRGSKCRPKAIGKGTLLTRQYLQLAVAFMLFGRRDAGHPCEFFRRCWEDGGHRGV